VKPLPTIRAEGVAGVSRHIHLAADTGAEIGLGRRAFEQSEHRRALHIGVLLDERGCDLLLRSCLLHGKCAGDQSHIHLQNSDTWCGRYSGAGLTKAV